MINTAGRWRAGSPQSSMLAGELMLNPLDKKTPRAVPRAVAMKEIEQGSARSEYVEE